MRRPERAKPAVDPEEGKRHLPGITTLPGNQSRLLKPFAKGSLHTYHTTYEVKLAS